MSTKQHQGWNPALLRAEASYERDDSIPALFSRIASRHAESPAAVSDHVVLTYADLHARALGVAASLRRLGVAPGETVAILCERSVHVPEAMLGILFAGAVFVPLDPRAPLARNASIAEFSRCRAVVSNGIAAPAGLPSIQLADIEPVRPGVEPLAERLATDAASVMFTSGSTGEPKGVLVPHRAIVRLCRNNWFFSAGPDTRFLHISSLAFDASTLEIWMPLLNGGSVVIAPEGALGLREIAETLRKHRATACFLTPALFNTLVDELPSAYDSLEVVITGGDVVSPRHIAALRARLPRIRIINGYGPTENTTFTTCHVIDAVDGETPIPIGRPISNSGVCVVDEDRRPVPMGVTGELVATGDGLAIGYLNRPDETARRFVTIEPLGVRGYLTGDRVLAREDGVIEFLGRVDDQIKIRGHRVEPGELEAFLRKQQEVRDAAVVVTGRHEGERALAAIVTVAPGSGWPPLRERLFQKAREDLPEYLVPRSISCRARMPLGSTGKIDRAALREQLELGHTAVRGWAAALPGGTTSAAWLGAVALLLSRAWHPYEPSAVILVLGGMRIELPSAEPDEGVRALVSRVERLVGGEATVPQGMLAAELRSPEGLETLLIADGDLRLVLPPGTSEDLTVWRTEHVARLASRLGEGGVGCRELTGGIVGAAERHRIESEWNDTAWGHGIDRTLVELFEEASARTPDQEALRSDEYSISYRQLLRRTNAVVGELRRAGIGPGDRVAVLDNRAIDAIVGVLGILRSGATCVPIDNAAPDARVSTMLHDARVELLVVPERARPPAAAWEIRSLVITAAEEPDAPIQRLEPASDAFVLFTSGSTGRPKGVPVRHESLVNRIAWMHRRFGLDARDMVLQRNRLTWDVSIWEYLWPLAFGARCFVAMGATVGDPFRLHECVRRNGVTILHLVPSLVGAFARAARAGGPTEIRLTCCSGETLSPIAAREYLEGVGGELYNLYGPTEAAIEVTCGRCLPQEDAVTIGRPAENNRIAITDEDGNPCPVGVGGEIRISGIQVSRGYCEAPGVSSEAFSVGTAPWPTFRTGDLGRWREDGVIEFLGRADAQIKLCGFRIEPEEIEAALAQHGAVAEACVCKVGEGIDAQLVGVCVGAGAADESSIRDHLRRVLEPSSVPTRFVWVDALPRISSGKIDRRRAGELAAQEGAGCAAGEPARRVVESVWRSLLGSSPGSDADNFMHAGGNSLTFLRLMLDVERRLGIELAAAPAMAEPTLGRIVATVEAVLRESRGELRAGAARGLAPGSSGELIRLTYGELPLVVLPHLGGTLGFLGDVLPHVAGEVAVHGVRARGLFDGEEPCRSADAMVDGYAAAIIAKKWSRLCVLGFSSGAVFGLGVASRLRERGVEVPLLIVVDSSLRITSHGRWLRALMACAAPVLRLHPRGAKLVTRWERLGEHVTAPQRRLMQAHLRALHRHTPSPYAGRALVVARQEMARHHNLAGWRRVLEGPAEEVRVDAGHMEMWREPHARTLAHTLLEHIRGAAGEGGAAGGWLISPGAIGVAIVDRRGADAPSARIT